MIQKQEIRKNLKSEWIYIFENWISAPLEADATDSPKDFEKDASVNY